MQGRVPGGTPFGGPLYDFTLTFTGDTDDTTGSVTPGGLNDFDQATPGSARLVVPSLEIDIVDGDATYAGGQFAEGSQPGLPPGFSQTNLNIGNTGILDAPDDFLFVLTFSQSIELESTTAPFSGVVGDGSDGFSVQLDFDTFSGVGLNFGRVLSPISLEIAVEDGPPAVGTVEAAPLLPDAVTEEGGFAFVIASELLEDGATVWIDPDIAVGYDYVAEAASFASVTAPSLTFVGDLDGYLLSFEGLTAPIVLAPGDTFDFAAPVGAFTLSGIDPELGLDPDDPLAFRTGVSFANVLDPDAVRVIQTPITAPVVAPVPLPAGWLTAVAAFGMLGALRSARSPFRDRRER